MEEKSRRTRSYRSEKRVRERPHVIVLHLSTEEHQAVKAMAEAEMRSMVSWITYRLSHLIKHEHALVAEVAE
jgi:hypothetical protein